MRYVQRSIKYFLSLCLVYAAMLYLMSLTEMMVLTRGETFRALMSTPRGGFMLFAVVALSAAYPRFGFVQRTLKGSVKVNREQIDRAFAQQHFKLMSEDERRLIYIADSPLKRLYLLFEDHILVTQVGDEIELRGNRKTVAYVLYRLKPAIEMQQQSEEHGA
ncbi:MAG: hypothetical protein R3Y39_03365 [Rikenellaceae bacterium]